MLPKQIDPCPIREAAVEIRFQSNLPADAIFGIVYSKLRDLFPTPTALPIMQIPEAVRNEDSKLMRQPYYRMENDGYVVQIGPRIFSHSRIGDYTTWTDFFTRFKTVLERIDDRDLFLSIERLGLRYINSFEGDILDKLNVEITLMGQNVGGQESLIRTVIVKESFKSILLIANSAELQQYGKEKQKASVIDIDTAFDGEIGNSSQIFEILANAHGIEKELFFGLLAPNFLESLSPTY